MTTSSGKNLDGKAGDNIITPIAANVSGCTTAQQMKASIASEGAKPSTDSQQMGDNDEQVKADGDFWNRDHDAVDSDITDHNDQD